LGQTTTGATRLAYHDLMHRMYLETGETDKAWTHIRAAHDIARQRVVDQNDSTASRLNLAAVCRDMSEMRRKVNRDMQAAIDYAREALELYDNVLAHPRPQPGDPPRLQVVLLKEQAHSSIAAMYVRMGDPVQALAEFERAQQVLDGIKTDPDYLKLPEATRSRNEAGFRDESSALLAGSGEMHFRLGRTDEARRRYAQALASREETNERSAGASAAVAKARLAAMVSQAGNLAMLSGEADKAAEHFERAIKLAGELTAADAKIVEYQQILSLAHFRRGVLRQMQDDPAAKESFEACRAIRTELAKDESNADRQRELLLVLPHCGQHRQAAALAEKLLAANRQPDIELLLDLARAYSQCGLAAADDLAAADAYRKSALAHLAQAVQAGHRDPGYLEREPDLAPLRGHSEFQAHLEQAKRNQAENKP
jgi:tetratricopeptide (TPR) repeat protein